VRIVLEARFTQAPDGTIWSAAAFPCSFWDRYLEVFDRVVVVARVAAGVPRTAEVRSDGQMVSFSPVPYYVGPWQYLLKRKAVRAAVQRGLGSHDAVILRVGSELANLAWPALSRRDRPYAVEVVGDPWDVFGPGVVRHPLRPFLRRYFRWHLARQCANAAAAAYVTERTLQRRYPASRGRSVAYSTAVIRLPHLHPRMFFSSDVVVPEPHAASIWRGSGGTCWRLVFVGSLEQLYKGPDVLLRALSLCRAHGLSLHLKVVGGGRCQPGLARLARQLAIEDSVEFLGTLSPGKAVYRQLAEADLFVLPSRTEGLPRALIEAMAFGLPCLATDVGGIPELLQPEDLVRAGDVKGLARAIEAVLTDHARRARMSERNLRRAADFAETALAPRRRAFYTYVREVTEAWVAGKPVQNPQ
jgi:glycosyltransferase involved in cell wall biosynthesis